MTTKIIIILLVSFFIFSNTGYARVTKITNCDISKERIEKLEDWVHKQSKLPSWMFIDYSVRGLAGFGNSKHRIGSYNRKTHVIRFDGVNESILVHELAHAYYANEEEAKAIQYKWDTKK